MFVDDFSSEMELPVASSHVADAEVRIREARSTDADWILPLSSRLHDFGPPPWRPREVMDWAVATDLAQALTKPQADSVVLVAELTEDSAVGFAHVRTGVDFFTKEAHSHLSDLAVIPLYEGRGVGRALMRAVELWGTARGHRLLTLNVFPGNEHARAVYHRWGFRDDTIRLIKLLEGSAAR